MRARFPMARTVEIGIVPIKIPENPFCLNRMAYAVVHLKGTPGRLDEWVHIRRHPVCDIVECRLGA